jgi:SAM-dependent methyltransferase
LRLLFYWRILLPYKIRVDIEARLRYNQIIEEYYEDQQKEWKQLSAHLPAQVTNTLDIGCGIGGINEFLYKHYSASRSVDVFLLDRNYTAERVFYGFHQDAAAYNSLSASKSYLVGRGVPKEAIQIIDVDRDALPPDISFDVILSLFSWGFHYPIQTYLEYVKGHLARNGTLIVDCRKGTDGIKILRRHFVVSVIDDRPNSTRVKCQHLAEGVSSRMQ